MQAQESVFSESSVDSADQPVIHFRIFIGGAVPAEIGGHVAVDYLVPLTLFIIVDALGISDGPEHFMSVVIKEAEAGSL